MTNNTAAMPILLTQNWEKTRVLLTPKNSGTQRGKVLKNGEIVANKGKKWWQSQITNLGPRWSRDQ